MFSFISKVCTAIMPSFMMIVKWSIGNANVQCDIYYYYYYRSINIKIRNKDQVAFYVFKIDQWKIMNIWERFFTFVKLKMRIICKFNFPKRETQIAINAYVNWIWKLPQELYRNQTIWRNQDMWCKYSHMCCCSEPFTPNVWMTNVNTIRRLFYSKSVRNEISFNVLHVYGLRRRKSMLIL